MSTCSERCAPRTRNAPSEPTRSRPPIISSGKRSRTRGLQRTIAVGVQDPGRALPEARIGLRRDHLLAVEGVVEAECQLLEVGAPRLGSLELAQVVPVREAG